MKGHTPNRIRPFGMRDKLGYMFGDFGNDFTFVLSTSILMKFYTDVMGVAPGVVGTLMMLARFVDAFTDVTMGRIADAAKPTAAGKFKPWLKRMCVPVALASFLIYAPGLADRAVLDGWSAGMKNAYLCVTYLLWGSFCYTGINIPYGSMASTISSDAGERQSLSSFRSIGATLAGTVIGMGLPMIAYNDDNTVNGRMVAIAALLFSVGAVVCYLLAYSLITERVPHNAPEKQEKTPLVRMFRSAVRNRALISIIAASIVLLLAQQTMQSMNAYIYPDYYGESQIGQLVATLVMTAAMLLASTAVKPLTQRFGKAEVSAAASLFAAAVCLAIWFIKPTSVWVFIGLQGLTWLGLGMFSMTCWALITDVVDYSEIKNGVREDGSVYALYSFARKLGQAVAAGLSGWLLEAIGYQAKDAGSVEPVIQTAAVKDGIFNITTLVPVVGFCLLALVLIFWYPLHKKQVDENAAILKAKRG